MCAATAPTGRPSGGRWGWRGEGRHNGAGRLAHVRPAAADRRHDVAGQRGAPRDHPGARHRAPPSSASPRGAPATTRWCSPGQTAPRTATRRPTARCGSPSSGPAWRPRRRSPTCVTAMSAACSPQVRIRCASRPAWATRWQPCCGCTRTNTTTGAGARARPTSSPRSTTVEAYGSVSGRRRAVDGNGGRGECAATVGKAGRRASGRNPLGLLAKYVEKLLPSQRPSP